MSLADVSDHAGHEAPTTVLVEPRGRLPEVAAVAGSNYAEVGVQVGEPEGGRRTVACFAALDNLIKGGAGQGIQNMNLMLDLPETLSLEDPGGWP